MHWLGGRKEIQAISHGATFGKDVAVHSRLMPQIGLGYVTLFTSFLKDIHMSLLETNHSLRY